MRITDVPRGPSFKPVMVRAILKGEKTETRRPLVPQFPDRAEPWLEERDGELCAVFDMGYPAGYMDLPYQPGRLYSLCEPLWAQPDPTTPQQVGANSLCAHYVADETPVYLPQESRVDPERPETMPWRKKGDPDNDAYEVDKLPAIFMPRVAARAFLPLEVRLERLQAMDGADARAEGILRWLSETDGWADTSQPLDTLESVNRAQLEAFEALWDNINPAYPWEDDPWVVVYSWEAVLTRRGVEKI